MILYLWSSECLVSSPPLFCSQSLLLHITKFMPCVNHFFLDDQNERFLVALYLANCHDKLAGHSVNNQKETCFISELRYFSMCGRLTQRAACCGGTGCGSFAHCCGSCTILGGYGPGWSSMGLWH